MSLRDEFYEDIKEHGFNPRALSKEAEQDRYIEWLEKTTIPRKVVREWIEKTKEIYMNYESPMDYLADLLKLLEDKDENIT